MMKLLRRDFLKLKISLLLQALPLRGLGMMPFGFWKGPQKYALWMWGDNSGGQLGQGDIVDRSSPVQVGSLTTWSDARIGNSYVLALKVDGTIWAWGVNNAGQLGVGDTVSRSSPVQVGSNSDWTAIAAGASQCFGLRGGKLYSWGVNSTGGLGLGDTTSRSTPVQIGSLSTWTKIHSGTQHAVGMTSDGKVWVWGKNDVGQIGQGDTVSRSTPVQLGSATNWVSFGMTANNLFAINSLGELWETGSDGGGCLGKGTSGAGSSISTLTKLASATDWITLGFCGNHILALRTATTNKLWGWGYNGTGNLSLGNTSSCSSPVLINSASNWLDVAGSGNSANAIFSYFLRSDGTLWSSGNNVSGQLGVGDTTSYSSMVQIGSSTNWKKLIPVMHVTNASSAGAFSEPTTTTNPVCLLRFNEASYSGVAGEALDSSGKSNHGVAAGNATTASGRYGNALTLDGTGDWITVTDSTSINFGTGNFSIACWIKTSSAGVYIVGKLSSTVGSYGIYLNSSGKVRIELCYNGGAPVQGTLSTAVVNNNAWRHIGFTVNRAGNATLYVDGVLDSTTDISAYAGQSTTYAMDLRIGARNSGTPLAYTGLIDDFALWNTALTASQITTTPVV